jgi:hypothetical protein
MPLMRGMVLLSASSLAVLVLSAGSGCAKEESEGAKDISAICSSYCDGVVGCLPSESLEAEQEECPLACEEDILLTERLSGARCARLLVELFECLATTSCDEFVEGTSCPAETESSRSCSTDG